MQSFDVFSGMTITYKITWSLSKPLGTVFLKKLSAKKKTLSHKYLASVQKSRISFVPQATKEIEDACTNAKKYFNHKSDKILFLRK